jgi:uncharacterized membrane protein
MPERIFRFRHALPIALVPLLFIVCQIAATLWTSRHHRQLAFNNPADFFADVVFQGAILQLSVAGTIYVIIGTIFAVIWWGIDNSSLMNLPKSEETDEPDRAAA